MRNARRRGGTLLDQAHAAHEAVAANAAAGSPFVTGFLGRLDLSAGILTAANAGHPAPLLVRDGVLQPVVLPLNRPFGVRPGQPYRAGEIALRAGDRLVVLTDGMIERGAAAMDLPARLLDLSAPHPREVARVLGDLVLDVAGSVLPDDACLLVIDWHAGHGDTRRTAAGTELGRAGKSRHG